MKALVTGGTGFVGGHLIDALLQAGDTVTVLARSHRKAAGLEGRGVRVIHGDLTTEPALREAARGQDVIYHAAGLVAARSPSEFLTVNRDGTARLVRAAAEVSGCRLVLISSLAAAGPVPRGTRRRGDETPAPVTAYGQSKLAGEQAVRSGGLPWVIVRPPAVYGPRDPEFLRVFRAARLGLVPLFGDGQQELSLVYAPDLAAAVVALGRASNVTGQVFYPCHSEVVSSGELARTIGRSVGRSVRLLRVPRWVAEAALALTGGTAAIARRATLLTPDKANEFFAPAWTADPAPLSDATGWQAAHDLASGTEATAAWYRAAGWLPAT